jgi:hypothetical protein
MATIAVLTGEHDFFHRREFMLEHLFPHWIEAGHFVVVHQGPGEPPPADIAILHVDLTVVPREYTETLGRYPLVLNGATADIRKRTYSKHLVTRGDGWDGPVIVKTDANCGALPELHWAQHEVRKGRRADIDIRAIPGPYSIHDSPSLVPAEVWDDRQLVVERFLPERHGDAYAMRAYVFLGDSERCNCIVGPHPIVKGADTIARFPVPVPDEIREERRRLGFDYGKIDFVVHEGTPILLDANRTPTMPRGGLSEAVHQGMKELSRGIESFVRPR